MPLIALVAIAVLIAAATTIILLLFKAPPAPHQQAERKAHELLPRPVRKFIEREADKRDKSAATTIQLAVVAMAALIGATAALFPFFKTGSIIAACVIAVVVTQTYLETAEAKRQKELDQQALNLLSLAKIQLVGQSHLSPAQILSNCITEIGGPLLEETAIIFPKIQTGQNFLPEIEAIIQQTRNKRLRRILLKWKSAEEEVLTPAGLAARLSATYEQEKNEDRSNRQIHRSIKNGLAGAWIVILVIPGLPIAISLLGPDIIYKAYTQTIFGYVGLAIVLSIILAVVYAFRLMIREAKKVR